jgi:hypothetical protein
MPRRPKPANSIKPLTAKPRRKSPPYPFILEALAPLNPEVRPMFSGHSVYIEDKIVCMLRDHPKSPQDNGIWLVFSETADLTNPALKREFPSLRPIQLLGGKINHWLVLPADSSNFESESLHACDLLLAHDPRLGRIPKSRSSSSARKKSPNKSA